MNPPCRSCPTLKAPWMAACVEAVSPDWPQPGPISTVGWTWPSVDESGNQWIRILVPSNDVRSKSDGTPTTGVAVVERQLPGGWQVLDGVAAMAGDEAVLEEEQAARAEPASTTAIGATMAKQNRAVLGDAGPGTLVGIVLVTVNFSTCATLRRRQVPMPRATLDGSAVDRRSRRGATDEAAASRSSPPGTVDVHSRSSWVATDAIDA